MVMSHTEDLLTMIARMYELAEFYSPPFVKPDLNSCYADILELVGAHDPPISGGLKRTFVSRRLPGNIMTTKGHRLTEALNAPHMANRQQTILYAIELWWRQNGYAPSIRDLQALCDISSTSVVKYHLERLRTAGLVDFVDGTPRTIRLVRSA